MGMPELYLLETFAMAASPLWLAIIATVFVWRSITRPALFLVLAILSLWGLSNFIYSIVLYLLNPSHAGPATYPSPQFNVLLANAVLVALIGIPVLLWLRNALRRA